MWNQWTDYYGPSDWIITNDFNDVTIGLNVILLTAHVCTVLKWLPNKAFAASLSLLILITDGRKQTPGRLHTMVEPELG